MRVLGLSAHFHDAAAALVVDGRVVAAAAEERFSRLKHDPSTPVMAAAWVLEQGGLSAHDLDAVVFYEQPHRKFTRVLASTLGGFPSTSGAFAQAMRRWLTDSLWTVNGLSKALDVHPRLIHTVPHHGSHAAQALLGSPFDEAAILTVDAVGEWVCTGIHHGKAAPEVDIQQKEALDYPHSLGLFYSAFTAFLGFKPNNDECTTMALAAFGEPRFGEQVRRVLRLHEDGTYELDASCFDFLDARSPFTSRFVEIFGAPRRPGPLPFRCDEAVAVGPEDQRWADLAASVQLVLEEAVLGLARRAHRLTGCDRLCLAGGVALNCLAVERVRREGPFSEVFVPPDPGDGGAAIGCAAWVGMAADGAPPAEERVHGPYLGRAPALRPSLDMLDHMGPSDWSEHRLAGLGPGPSALRVERHEDPAELTRRSVELLEQGAILGWFQDRFEFGPRALGNRSILMHPGRSDRAEVLSRRVKLRAPYRPYALAFTEEAAGQALGWDEVPLTGRWMQTVSPVREQHQEALTAGLHVDGTTRPQVCGEGDNPRFHKLLRAFGERTGLEALLNTSFNERGYPMVATADEALIQFARTDMDALALGDTLIIKEA